ncbi:MAG: DUF2277 domain-containing protein [Verrucomicrobiota bacterium]
MCRNIKTLHNFSPPATDDEIRASSLQFVRKLSGFTKPSQANEEAFNRAVDEVTHIAHHLLDSLVTNAPPRDRETEALKARARSAKRFSHSNGDAAVHHHH